MTHALTTALCLLSMGSFAAPTPPDTIVVKLRNADKILIITPPGANRIRGYSEVDLNKIMATVDSTLQANRGMIYTFESNGIRMTPIPPIPPIPPLPPIPPTPGIEVDMSKMERDMAKMERDMEKAERDMEKAERDMERNGRAPNMQLDTNFVIQEIQTLRSNGRGSNNGNDKKTIAISVTTKNGPPRIIVRERWEDRGDAEKYRPRRSSHYSRNGITIGLGLTNYLNSQGTLPSEIDKWYGLNPAGSRYFSLGWKWGHRFNNSRLGFNYGVEVAWQNFMLEDSYRFRKGTTGLDSIDYRPREDGSRLDDINVRKSKLVQVNLKVPVSLALRVGRTWFVEAGAFGGVRIDSYTKFKYDQRGDTQKDRERKNYYLNSLQYGLAAQVRNKSWGVFGEYHLNEVFTSKGPRLNAVQVGVSFWGI